MFCILIITKLIIMYIQNISLGRKEVQLLSTLEHDQKSVFSFEDALKVLAGTKRQVVRNILSKLAKKARIERIKKGTYMLVPFSQKAWAEHELSVIPLMAGEYYVSFWSALKYFSMTEQLPRTVFIATRKQKKSRSFQGIEYKFIKLSAKNFGGYEETNIEGRKVRIASREKTVLDCLAHPEYCGGIGEPTKAIKYHWKELNWKKVKEYLKEMKNSAVERRLLYILKTLKITVALRKLKEKKFKGYRQLDPSRSKGGVKEKTAGLQLNVDLGEEIL